MNALRFHQFGKPSEVLSLDQIDRGQSLRLGEVRVKVLASPINPADLNLIEGTYGRKPPLPAVAGIEGCGEIVESSHEMFQEGDRVIFLQAEGLWTEEVVVPAQNLWKLSEDLDPDQAAMLKVNPATAWHLLHPTQPLSSDGWVIQNAANSGVGRAVIGLAKKWGLRTVNLVRKAEYFEDLKQLGADHVLLDVPESVDHIKEILGDEAPQLALNAVGGESALRLMNVLGKGGELVTYGAMARRPLTVPNGLLIFKNLRLSGFWLTPWIAQASEEEIDAVYGEVASAMKKGEIHMPLDSVHELPQFHEALERVAASDRAGKVLFCPSPERCSLSGVTRRSHE